MNKRIAFSLIILSIMSLCVVSASTVKASPKTIIVPDDYSTIQAAIDNTTAGGIVFVRSGTYNETLTVEKSISLVGENSSTTIIIAPKVTNTSISQGLTTTIQVNADNVNVSNLTINNQNAMGLGISTSGNGTQIIGNTVNAEIAVFTNGAFTNINENTISGYFTGVSCGSTNSNFITNNDILLSHSYGIELERSSFNAIWGNKIIGFAGYGVFINGDSNNVTGNTVTEKSDGISVSSGSFNIITENSVTNCTDIGLRIDQGLNNTFSGNGVAECKYGVGIGEAAYNNTIYRNNIINNVQQASTSNVSNYWDNGKEGNYWSDYLTKYPNATEIDSTGIGNTPYVIDVNNIDHYPLMKPSVIPEFPSLIFVLPLIIAVSVGLLVYYFKKHKR